MEASLPSFSSAPRGVSNYFGGGERGLAIIKSLTLVVRTLGKATGIKCSGISIDLPFGCAKGTSRHPGSRSRNDQRFLGVQSRSGILFGGLFFGGRWRRLFLRGGSATTVKK